MLLFWIIAVLLLLAILAMLLPAVVRTKTIAGTDINEEKRAIFRQQFAELEQDKLNGTLDGSQYDVARSELERRMLDEAGTLENVPLATKPDWRLGFLLLVILPLSAGLLYYKLGSPQSITIPAVSPESFASQPAVEHSTMMGDMESLLASLKQKLESNPDNGEGWALLARSYVELRQHAQAIPAYEKAATIITDDAQLLADYADALAVVNGHQLEGRPEALIAQALKLDAHNIKALMLAATVAFDRQNYRQAIEYWERLQQDLPPDSELLSDVNASMHEARVLSGDASTRNTPPLRKMPVQSVGVSGIVTIQPKLAAQLDPSVTVFIYARASHGASMPLAIVRTTVGALPYAYQLDDSSALVPNHKISQADEVVVVARVSKAGDAKQQPGDLQGMTGALKPHGQKVDVEINQVIE